MALNAFLPQGNTILIAATTVPSAPVQVTTGGIQGVMVSVQGSSQHIFLATGQSTATAALPSTGTPGTGMPFFPNAQRAISCPPGAYVSVMTSSGTANVFLTPGIGQ